MFFITRDVAPFSEHAEFLCFLWERLKLHLLFLCCLLSENILSCHENGYVHHLIKIHLNIESKGNEKLSSFFILIIGLTS